MVNYNSDAQSLATYKSQKWHKEGTPTIVAIGGIVGVLGFMAASVCNPDLFTFVNGAGALVVGGIAPNLIHKLSKGKSVRRNAQEITGKINAAILDLTGDASQQITTQQVHAIMDEEAVESVPVNGVPGIEVYSRNESGSHNVYDREIVIQNKTTDNGIESFDHLVEAAARKHRGFQSVSGLYRKDAS